MSRQRRIVLTYYAKSVNMIAGGKGGRVVSNDVGVVAAAAVTGLLTSHLYFKNAHLNRL
jgi:hypothetical protein